ncbi:hypothetical protein EA658_06070 [Pseudoxanthomonas winnipegensis]|uniref:Uncharacterized protein n=1 Tax=Pseudoxanthomonas winnipegensis TaxID=2480810 RepID=A0ABY1WF74_9GAMM|nr:hypothetical protein EA659_13305 [Pseudoxanthomonas winnipegensis]TAA20524.1 hypothetical protein EA658_06070 [Pseudoxanthomonas winnipegensis]TAH71822.1 hypothetical protein EA657_11920 [Pseudoxanthomonas winnipegensis]
MRAISAGSAPSSRARRRLRRHGLRDERAQPHLVVPAKAGTHGRCLPGRKSLDSRVRGNDGRGVLAAERSAL